jgi:hypothetical protein
MENFDFKKYLAENKLQGNLKTFLEEGKTNELYELFEKIYDAGVEGVDYDENFGYSSKPFQDYWKENQVEIMQMLRRIY